VQIYITFLLKFVLPLHLPASLKRVSSTHSTIHLFFYCCVCFCLARLKSALGYPGPSILGYLALCFPQRTTLNQLPSNRQNSDMPNVVGALCHLYALRQPQRPPFCARRRKKRSKARRCWCAPPSLLDGAPGGALVRELQERRCVAHGGDGGGRSREEKTQVVARLGYDGLEKRR
jgi:hypothetical protein